MLQTKCPSYCLTASAALFLMTDSGVGVWHFFIDDLYAEVKPDVAWSPTFKKKNLHLLLSVLVFTVKKITQETISGRKTSLFDVKVKRGRRYCYRLKQIPISRRRFRKQQLINTTCVGSVASVTVMTSILGLMGLLLIQIFSSLLHFNGWEQHYNHIEFNPPMPHTTQVYILSFTLHGASC